MSYDYISTHKIGHLSKKEQLAYWHGISNGISAFAWWKEGTQYVGTCGTVLSVFLRPIDNEINRLEEELKEKK